MAKRSRFITSVVRYGSCVLTIGLCAGSVAQAEVKAQIVDYGVTTGLRPTENVGRQRGDTGLSPSRPMYQLRYVERSDTVEARLCRNFGITVRLSGAASDRIPEEVRVRVLHPLFKRPDGKTSREDAYASTIVDGQSNVGFTFDHAWEIEPGEWTMIVYAAKAELVRKTFTVTAPKPGAASECKPGA